MTPKLWNGELSRVLREEVLEDDVERPTGDAKEVAGHGAVKGNDGATFLPLFLGFEVDDAVRDGGRRRKGWWTTP